MAAPALTDALVRRGVAYELIPHRHTETAAAEARAVGVSAHMTAKTVVVRTDDGFARVVVPASCRIDPARVARVLGVGAVALATEAELAGAYPAFPLGAVPPFDALDPDPVVVDRRLARVGTVVFGAGSHEEAIEMRTADLVAAADALVADVCERQ